MDPSSEQRNGLFDLKKSHGTRHGIRKWIATYIRIVGLSEPKVARICVAMNSHEETFLEVWLETKTGGGYFQPLEYPYFSFHKNFSIMGHKSEDCKNKERLSPYRKQQPWSQPTRERPRFVHDACGSQ